ncbi:MAG: MFS transporter [Pseudomonadota bacterium]
MSLKTAGALVTTRRFVPLWLAQTLGAFNDNLFRYSLVTLAAYQGFSVLGLEREVMAPIAATAFTLPIFMFSAVAGQLADRYDRTAIMRVTKFIEIFLMLIAAAGFLLGDARLLLLALFLMGVQTAFFIPARTSAMPTLLEPSELVTANALVSGTVNVAILAGAIGGTALIAMTWGLNAISGALIICAVIGWLAIRQGAPAKPSEPVDRINWNIITETARILGYVFKLQEVLRPLLGVAWFWMMAAAVVTLLPIFTRDVLHADPLVVALFQLLFTVGAAAGAILCGLLTRGGDAIVFTLIGAVGLVVFPLDLALYTFSYQPSGSETSLTGVADFIADPANRRIMIDLVCAAVAGGFFVVPLQAMIQRRATPERRGRILAGSGILNGASASLGQFVLAGLALVNAPLQGAFIFVALGSLIAAVFTLTRILARRNAPG